MDDAYFTVKNIMMVVCTNLLLSTAALCLFGVDCENVGVG